MFLTFAAREFCSFRKNFKSWIIQRFEDSIFKGESWWKHGFKFRKNLWMFRGKLTPCSPVSRVYSTLWFTRSLYFSQRSKRWMITPGKLYCSNVYRVLQMAKIDHCARLLLRNTGQLKIKTKYFNICPLVGIIGCMNIDFENFRRRPYETNILIIKYYLIILL